MMEPIHSGMELPLSARLALMSLIALPLRASVAGTRAGNGDASTAGGTWSHPLGRTRNISGTNSTDGRTLSRGIVREREQEEAGMRSLDERSDIRGGVRHVPDIAALIRPTNCQGVGSSPSLSLRAQRSNPSCGITDGWMASSLRSSQ